MTNGDGIRDWLVGKTPFEVACAACSHHWIALWTPMEMDTAARLLLSLHCPICGSDADRIVARGNLDSAAP